MQACMKTGQLAESTERERERERGGGGGGGEKRTETLAACTYNVTA